MRNGVVQVHATMVEVYNDLSHEADEGTRSSYVALQHPQPLVQASWRNECNEIDII